MKLHFTANEVAKLAGVDRATVTRWIKRGLLPGVHRPVGTRNWRIPLTAYESFVKHKDESR
jgi:excisionase family DNA binding protein